MSTSFCDLILHCAIKNDELNPRWLLLRQRANEIQSEEATIRSWAGLQATNPAKKHVSDTLNCSLDVFKRPMLGQRTWPQKVWTWPTSSGSPGTEAANMWKRNAQIHGRMHYLCGKIQIDPKHAKITKIGRILTPSWGPSWSPKIIFLV